MKIAILVPFYNEEKNLIFFVKEWDHIIKKRKFKNLLYFFFIDDGSNDKSLLYLKKILGMCNLNFKIFKKKNSGHGESCKFGYKKIIDKNFDYIMQVDSDNQCDPKDFVKFYEKIKNKKLDFVFGYRKKRGDGNLRVLVSKFMSFVFFLKKRIYIKDLNTPYRVMNTKKLRNVFKSINNSKKLNDIKLFNCLLSYEISKKYPINWIDIYFRERHEGISKFSMINMFKLFINFIFKI